MRQLLMYLALSAWIPLCWQPLRGQAPSVWVQPSHNQKQQTKLATTQTQDDHRGTKKSPLVVDVLNSQKTPEEAAQAKAEKDHKYFVDRWTLRIAAVSVFINGVLVIVGIFGVLYARRTLNDLKRQVDLTEPRLHVDCVRVSAFENGQSPVFFVRVINSGIIAAENATISMAAEIAAGRTVRYDKDQVIAIPAGGWRECFIRSGVVLDQKQLAAYDNETATLRISGHLKWSGKTTEYCYKYNPWSSGNRPEGVPVFVPCDFKIGLETAIQVGPATLTMSPEFAAVKIEGPSPEPPQDVDKPS